MLTLTKMGSNEYSVSVLSLEFCEMVLRMAGDQKLMEVRSCLEGKYIVTSNIIHLSHSIE